MASRSGASSGGKVEIVGLKEFRQALRSLGPEWPKALRAANKRIADRGALLARGYAAGMGGVQAKAAGAIKGYANQREIRIGIGSGKALPMAAVAFWGAKRHTGWYARARYHDSTPQHPEWVGNSWDVAAFGQGPYAINQSLAMNINTLLEEYFTEIEVLAHDAFPEG